MNKKTFQNRPIPSPLNTEDIASFVQSGPGLDQIPEKLALQENGKPAIRIDANTTNGNDGKPEKQKTDKPAFVNFTVKIPTDLHRRYKASCSMRGVKMVDEITEFIITRLEN